MQKIKDILMRRDGITSEEADRLIDTAREELEYYLEIGDLLACEEICYDHFGLEPDYLKELI